MPRLGAKGVVASTLGNFSMVGGQSIRTLLVAKLLGPADFGILNLVNVGTNFAVYSDLGTGVAGQQEVSTARGRGDLVQAQEQLVAVSRARLVPGYALSVLLLVTGVTLSLLQVGNVGTTLLFVALSAPLQAIWFCARDWLRVQGQFRLAATAQLGQVAVWVVAVPIAAWQGGLFGALLTLALSYLPPTLIAARVCPVWRMLRPSWSGFRRLVPAGMPIWFMAISSFLMLSIDQVLAATLLGSAALGIYAIAMLTSTALVAVSDGAAAAAHPQTLEAYARDGHLGPRAPSVVRVMEVVELAFGCLVPASWLGLALIAQFFLTDYRTAIPVVTFLSVSSAMIGIATASNATLLAAGLHRRLPLLMALTIGVKVAAAYVLVPVWASPLAIAVASALGSAFYALAYLWMVARVLSVERPLLFVLSHLQGILVLAALAVACAWAYLTHGMSGFWVAASTALVVGASWHGVIFAVRRRGAED